MHVCVYIYIYIYICVINICSVGGGRNECKAPYKLSPAQFKHNNLCVSSVTLTLNDTHVYTNHVFEN